MSNDRDALMRLTSQVCLLEERIAVLEGFLLDVQEALKGYIKYQTKSNEFEKEILTILHRMAE